MISPSVLGLRLYCVRLKLVESPCENAIGILVLVYSNYFLTAPPFLLILFLFVVP